MGCDELLRLLRLDVGLMRRLDNADTLVDYDAILQGGWRQRRWDWSSALSARDPLPLSLPSQYSEADRCFRSLLRSSKANQNANNIWREIAEHSTPIPSAQSRLYAAHRAHWHLTAMFYSRLPIEAAPLVAGGLDAGAPRDLSDAAVMADASQEAGQPVSPDSIMNRPVSTLISSVPPFNPSDAPPAQPSGNSSLLRNFAISALVLIGGTLVLWRFCRPLHERIEILEAELRGQPRLIDLPTALREWQRVRTTLPFAENGRPLSPVSYAEMPENIRLHLSRTLITDLRLFLERILSIELRETIGIEQDGGSTSISRAEIRTQATALLQHVNEAAEQAGENPLEPRIIEEFFAGAAERHSGIDHLAQRLSYGDVTTHPNAVVHLDRLALGSFDEFNSYRRTLYGIDETTREPVNPSTPNRFLDKAREFYATLVPDHVQEYVGTNRWRAMNEVLELGRMLEHATNRTSENPLTYADIARIESKIEAIWRSRRAEVPSGTSHQLIQQGERVMEAFERFLTDPRNPTHFTHFSEELEKFLKKTSETDFSPGTYDRSFLHEEARALQTISTRMRNDSSEFVGDGLNNTHAAIRRFDRLVSQIQIPADSRAAIVSQISSLQANIHLWRAMSRDSQISRTTISSDMTNARGRFERVHATILQNRLPSHSDPYRWGELLAVKARRIASALYHLETNITREGGLAEADWNLLNNECAAYRRVLEDYRCHSSPNPNNPDHDFRDPPDEPPTASAVVTRPSITDAPPSEAAEDADEEAMSLTATRRTLPEELRFRSVFEDEEDRPPDFLRTFPMSWTLLQGVRYVFRVGLVR